MRVPQAPEAEKSVLAGCMLDNDRVFDALGHITDDDFVDTRRKVVWLAMVALAERREPIDPVTLEQALGPQAMSLVGGVEALGKLADRYASAQHVERYARIIAATARRRRLMLTCREVADEAGEAPEDEDQWLGDAERRLLAASEARGADQAVTMADTVSDRLRAAQGRGDRTVVGTPTPIAELTDQINGWQEGKLIVGAGRPGHGKSAFAGCAMTIAAMGVAGRPPCPCLEFALEMDRAELTDRRLLTVAATLGPREGFRRRFDRGQIDEDDWRVLVKAGDIVQRLPITVDDSPRMTMSMITARSRRWRRRNPGPALITIDYLQLIRIDRWMEALTREQQVAAMAGECKLLSRELECPIMLLAQLNRKVDERQDHRPILSDLRESGAIEQDADLVLFFYRACQYMPDKTTAEYRDAAECAEVIIGKQRGGETGIVPARYQGEFFRWDNP